MAEIRRFAINGKSAAARPLRAGQDVEQLVLALALECDDAEHFAGVKVECGVAQAAVAELTGADARRLIGVRGTRGRGDSSLKLGDGLAEHQLDDALL